MTNNKKQLFVFVGSYAPAESNGVYVYALNEENGQLTLLDEVDGLANPTFLNIDEDKKFLYSISEGKSDDGSKSGEVASFAIDAESGKLKLVNRLKSVEGTTCHIQRHPELPYLTVTSYHGGMIGLLSIEEDGSIGRLLDVSQHTGASVHPERQDRPHPHSSFYGPDGAYLYVQDLGLDRIVRYRVDQESEVLVRDGETVTEPGAGPRHLAFHPDGKHAFVINEVNSTITSYRVDSETGELQSIETVPTLPEGFLEENTCAEIIVSSNGKMVYGSNRGHDSIVVYAFDEANEKLTYVEHVSTEGGHPRHFSLTPDERFMLVANRDGNHIVTFAVDQATGRLTYTGQEAKVSKPVFVKAVYLT